MQQQQLLCYNRAISTGSCALNGAVNILAAQRLAPCQCAHALAVDQSACVLAHALSTCAAHAILGCMVLKLCRKL